MVRVARTAWRERIVGAPSRVVRDVMESSLVSSPRWAWERSPRVNYGRESALTEEDEGVGTGGQGPLSFRDHGGRRGGSRGRAPVHLLAGGRLGGCLGPLAPSRREAPMTAYDVVAIGRVGVDLYPLQHGVTLDEVRTSRSTSVAAAANVTVAAARHGRRAALVSATAGATPSVASSPRVAQPASTTPTCRRSPAGHPRRSRSARSSRRTTSRSGLPLPDRAGPAHHRGILPLQVIRRRASTGRR